ncbi:BtrH N-terminal domain-containing protein [Micromonospora inyonensis]|uniref:BtrH N-terminal domain-containing protein n=1 Tax=Micromonospora inyonensis TaxID=47866 RepID=UPI00159F31A2|nr:BtrH N-terminal domain-containing protein [Micromonospora inyonensis]
MEAVLRAQGFNRHEVARALALPVDLTGGRRSSGAYRSGHLLWRNTADGRKHWSELTALVRAGTPVILMPDRYYWPGDEFEGRQHFLDHMVLVVAADDDCLVVLDTNAPAKGHYTRVVPVTPAVVRSACRFATAHFERPVDTAETLRLTLLEPTARWLVADLPAVAEFGEGWRVEGITGPLARALHVLVLGELQPNLFLTGAAVAEAFLAVAAAATAAADRAQSLGELLLGAHRYAPDADDATVYRPVLGTYLDTEAALRNLCGLLQREVGEVDAAPVGHVRDDRLRQRVIRMQAWCFADEVAAPEATEETT